uniref:SAP domain-containing protein n=1 Tax=Angiostrongylus cantonensis TaxID=6313 RepID=A0A0K0D1D1_ANGCA
LCPPFQIIGTSCPNACVRNLVKCLRRDKRSTSAECEVDEFLVTRMKRQAYNPSGILDIVKVLSKTMASEAGPNGCVKFPACILAKRKRRKRHAERTEHYHKATEYRQVFDDHEKHHLRQKRQFFTPDANAACVPCPAWVTLALVSRRKRSTNSSNELGDDEIPHMTISEAIADIRKRAGYELGFPDDDESPRRKQGACEQTDDCLNEVEYAIFKKVYHNTRVKREIFRRRKCERCGSGSGGKRVKRNFGEPTINASEFCRSSSCKYLSIIEVIFRNICPAIKKRRQQITS